MGELFLQAGANPNAKDFYSRTPLILAAASGNADLIDLMLKSCQNLDVNA